MMGALVMAGLSLSGSVPEPAAACSCVELQEQVDLELVGIEAVDGGSVDEEAAFWPSEARLVRTSTDEAFDSEPLTISLQRRSVP